MDTFIPEFLLDGEPFIKWWDETSSIIPIHLRVDENKFFVYWVNNSTKEVCTLDVSQITDVRTNCPIANIGGSGNRNGQRLRDNLNFGSINQTLESKTITIVSCTDFVNLNYHYFTAGDSLQVEKWTTQLLKIVIEAKRTHPSKLLLLRKLHTKLTLSNNFLNFFANTFSQSKEEKRRIQIAIEQSMPEAQSSPHLTFETFMKMYIALSNPTFLQHVYKEHFTSSTTASAFANFLNKCQRDPRLNVRLFPFVTEEKAAELISHYCDGRSCLDFEGFFMYVMGEENVFVDPKRYTLNCGMEEGYMDNPLSHYFISSSHNTYLTGNQFTGNSSVEMYRQVLLSGCRCVELDFWNGPDGDPVVVHGYTLVPAVRAKHVIEAIAESAFKTSDFPLILSFENYCSPTQQVKIVQYCREYFGDRLLESVMQEWPLERGVPLPPPSALKRKVIIKTRTKDGNQRSQPKVSPVSSPLRLFEEQDDIRNGDDLSALVTYVQPVIFSSFEDAKGKQWAYEMSSFEERRATGLLKENAIDFAKYNKFQLSRIYPKPTRVDSSNNLPHLFWSAGSQLVALNYQTLDVGMQLNLGMFELNGRSGYVLKPEFIRRTDRLLNPLAESTIDGIVAARVEIKILAGQCLSNRTQSSTYAEVEMYGLPADTVRKRFKTKIVQNNGMNPVFGDGPFVFKKVILPELAVLRFAAYDEGNKLLGQRIAPLVGLQSGYRCIPLYNEAGQPLCLPTLFVQILCTDFVPDGWAEVADALENPIRFQEKQERGRIVKEMIRNLLGDDDEDDDDNANVIVGHPKAITTATQLEEVSSLFSVVVPPFEFYLSNYQDKLDDTACEFSSSCTNIISRSLALSEVEDPENYGKILSKIHNSLEKAIREAHAQQMALLEIRFWKGEDVIRKGINQKIQYAWCRLPRQTSNKRALGRMKREVTMTWAQKASDEGTHLRHEYEKYQAALKTKHDQILQDLEDWKYESNLTESTDL